MKSRALRRFNCEHCKVTFHELPRERADEASRCPCCGRVGNYVDASARREFYRKKLQDADKANRSSFVCRALESLGPEKLACIGS